MINKSMFRSMIEDIFTEEVRKEARAEGLSDIDQIKVVSTSAGLELKGPDKYKWVQLGRKKGSGKGSRVPIQVLIKWIKKKNIKPNGGQSINSLAWAIQTSIYQTGIKNAVEPRPFVERAYNNLASKFPSLVGG